MTDASPLALTVALLDALEPLPHTERMGELAVRTRRLAAEGALRAVLDELEDGDPYERRIAVIAAAVGRDDEWIGARLADEDAVVRGHALRAARTLGVPDPAYESAFADAPAAVRRHLVRAIVADRRTALADRLVITARETYGDIEAARLLPGCSATTVAALLPELRRSTDCWSSLGHHHPGPLLDAAEEELAGLPTTARDAWWQDEGHPRVSPPPSRPCRTGCSTSSNGSAPAASRPLCSAPSGVSSPPTRSGWPASPSGRTSARSCTGR